MESLFKQYLSAFWGTNCFLQRAHFGQWWSQETIVKIGQFQDFLRESTVSHQILWMLSWVEQDSGFFCSCSSVFNNNSLWVNATIIRRKKNMHIQFHETIHYFYSSGKGHSWSQWEAVLEILSISSDWYGDEIFFFLLLLFLLNPGHQLLCHVFSLHCTEPHMFIKSCSFCVLDYIQRLQIYHSTTKYLEMEKAHT